MYWTGRRGSATRDLAPALARFSGNGRMVGAKLSRPGVFRYRAGLGSAQSADCDELPESPGGTRGPPVSGHTWVAYGPRPHPQRPAQLCCIGPDVIKDQIRQGLAQRAISIGRQEPGRKPGMGPEVRRKFCS
jgi:hypothetical protein